MKRNTLIRTVVFFGFLFLFIQSCKKGDTGPAGKDGAANVIYSAWFTPTPYIKDTVFGIWGFKYNKATPDITQNMLDSGTIITFGKLIGYNPLVWPVDQVAQMPISITYMQGGVTTDTWSALASVGNLRIRFVNDRNIYTTIASNHQFRYIIIPPGKKATLARNTGNGPLSAEMPASNMAVGRVARDHTTMTYQEICRLLDIPE